MTGLEGDAAIACRYCGAGWFRGDDGDAGWLLPPRLNPEDALAPAKTWLRERDTRVIEMGTPRGLLLPYWWLRGSRLVWSLPPVTGPEPPREESLLPRHPEPPPADAMEPRFATRVYAHTLPAHPLSEILAGRAARLDSRPLALLDPDHLPPGYRLVLPEVADFASGRALWLRGWIHRTEEAEGSLGRAATVNDRANLVVLPAIAVPMVKRGGERGAVAVDGETGRVVREIPREWWDAVDGAVAEDGKDERRVRQWSLDVRGAAPPRWLPFWVYGSARPGAFPTAPRFVPAYAARHPEDQLHLAMSLARRPPEGPWYEDAVTPRWGATVGSAEAGAWRWALEGALLRGNRVRFTRYLQAREGSPEPEPPAGISWIPFTLHGGDLIEPRTGARVRAVGTTPWGGTLRAA